MDNRQIGKVYYVTEGQPGQVSNPHDQGRDVLDDFSFEELTDCLRKFQGKIKGILTRGRVIAGIRNAYSDEILFAAKAYPFRGENPPERRRAWAHIREFA